ncbi:hypothetical protein [Nonomuraea rhizosphaerae]|uniref:hypothetical protein n=1 Tax=Nonomuraea rhizosphaerae TaxID=2665663 RepID=UPI001C60116F|nr:hypothetical protein [Nonomuraea rhizosphaerae]
MGVVVSKLDVARLREPAAWLMLAAGATNILVSIGRVVVGSSGTTGGSVMTFAERAFANFGNFTNPVTTALLLGAVLLLTKVGPPSPQARAMAYGSGAVLALATVFGAITLVLGVLGDNVIRLSIEFVLRGVPALALTALAFVYLLPQLIPDRPAAQPQPQGFGQPFPQGPYGQQPPSGQFGQQPDFGQQPGYGQQPPSAPYQQPPAEQPAFAAQQAPDQPPYGQQPPEQPPYGQQPAAQPPVQSPMQSPGQTPAQPPVQPAAYGQQPPSYGGAPVEQPAAYAQQPPSAAQPVAEPLVQAEQKPEYQPAPYVPADSQPSPFSQPYNTPEPQAGPFSQPYNTPEPQAGAFSQPFNTPEPQAGAFSQSYNTPDPQAGAFSQPYNTPEPQAAGPYALAGDTPPNPFAPVNHQPNPWAPAEQPPPPPQGGQPFTGYSGHEYATPNAYQEPDPPVDPRSQQLLDAYQQAETYQHTTPPPGQGPDLRVPDYTSQQQQATPYDGPFGHPQQPFPGSQQQYEPQPGQYEPQPYQGHHQAPQPPPGQPQWGDPVGESTIKLDQSMYPGDALGDQQPGEATIDPTAIYTPNDPRR